MPRIETTTRTLYTFEELSEEAQTKAIADAYEINIYYQWWDFVYDDAKHIATLLGLKIDQIYFSGFSSQGDGACFQGSYGYQKNSLKLVKDYAPKDETLHRIASDLIALQRPAFYQLTAQTYQRGHYMHSGCMTVDVSRWDDSGRRCEDDVTQDQDDGLTEAMRDFANWIYKRLESEHDYLTSEDTIRETLIANEYEYLESGERA